MTPANTCHLVEGRLLEIDLAAGLATVADIDAILAAVGGQLATLPRNKLAVIAGDWRECKLFTPEVAERAVPMLVSTNPRIERSAILHRADQATSVLQVFRLVKESQFEQRRLFTRPAEMQEWLAPVLSTREQHRLHAFLAQR